MCFQIMQWRYTYIYLKEKIAGSFGPKKVINPVIWLQKSIFLNTIICSFSCYESPNVLGDAAKGSLVIDKH